MSTRRLPDLELPIRLPFIEPPADLPLAEQEAFRNRALLEANGFGADRTEWRRATTHPVAVVRFAAQHLLAQAPEPEDAPRFVAALDDESGLVRALAATGLARLGDPRATAALVEALSSAAGEAPVFAAGALAERGDPRGFGVILRHLAQSPTPHVALGRLLPFAAHQGARLDDGTVVDIWPACEAALEGDDPNLHGVAVAHLGALGGDRARALLERYLKRRPTPPLAVRARAQLASILDGR